MLSLSHEDQANIIEAFNSTSRHLADLILISISYDIIDIISTKINDKREDFEFDFVWCVFFFFQRQPFLTYLTS